MFCPKCGTQIPDNAMFCNKCGNQLKDRVQTAQQPGAAPGAYGYGQQAGGAYNAQPRTYGAPYQAAPSGMPVRTHARPAAAGMGLTPMGIIGRVLALIALILLFMPILSIPAMGALSGYMGDLSSYSNELMRYGVNMNDINMLMSGSYSALDLNTICQMAARMDASSSSGYYVLIGYLILFGLIIMAALLVGGLVMSFINTKSTKLVRVGGIVVAGMAIGLAISLLALNAQIQQEMARQTYGLYGSSAMGSLSIEVPITVWLLFLCALASFIMLDIDAKQQLNGAVEYPDPLAVGSIASCLTGLYGIIVSIVAIVRNKDSRNKRLAIIGLVVNIVIIVISVLLGAAAVR